VIVFDKRGTGISDRVSESALPSLEQRMDDVRAVMDAAFREEWASYLRAGASPVAAIALLRMNTQIDIRPILPSIRVPTLVLHRKDDRLIRVECGRYLAEHIPGARLVEFPGADHLFFVGDVDSVVDESQEFLTAARVLGKAGPGEVLASQTVRDLVAGSGLSFQDRGVHALDGIPGEWRLFAAEAPA
jgi:pimeloyl-ACP methyl ester carboxylesterase